MNETLRSVLITKTKTMKTFENLQAKVVKLGNETKSISEKVDMRETYKGIETFDAELVMDKLNRLATSYENLSVTYTDYSKDNLNNSSKYWAQQADANYQAGREIRDTITYLIRMQKIENKIKKLSI